MRFQPTIKKKKDPNHGGNKTEIIIANIFFCSINEKLCLLIHGLLETSECFEESGSWRSFQPLLKNVCYTIILSGNWVLPGRRVEKEKEFSCILAGLLHSAKQRLHLAGLTFLKWQTRNHLVSPTWMRREPISSSLSPIGLFKYFF